jgi:methylmalonyl-CoA mutase cobalamin-binding domain/chain
MAGVQCSIKMAAQKTGLSPHVIRMWQKRYEAVNPERSESHRRLYSDKEIERLTLLGVATRSGHRISDIARLTEEELRLLVSEIPPGREPANPLPASTHGVLERIVVATKKMERKALEDAFDHSAVSFGHHGMLKSVIAPAAQIVGELWRDGVITAAHEHFFSGTVRTFLLRRFKPFAESDRAPRMVVVTPLGQLHELGAALVAAAARDMGWRVFYLGANLPATDIAGAAIQHKANAVALSIVFPGDDSELPKELEYLKKLLPPETDLLVGGRASSSYASTLKKIGSIWASDLDELYRYLDHERLPKIDPETEAAN